MYGSEVLKAGLRWRLGDGCKVKFWTDIWIGNEPLLPMACIPFSQVNLGETLSEYISNGYLDMDKLHDVLMPEAIQKILNVPAIKHYRFLFLGSFSQGSFLCLSTCAVTLRN